LMHQHLDHPLLLLFLPVLLAVATLVLQRTLVQASRAHKALQLVVRTLLFAAIVLGLAGPSAERPPRGRSVVALVDLSASIDAEALAKAKRHLDAVRAAKGRDDRLDVVAFGRRAQHIPLVDGQPLAWPTDLDAEATDLEGALRLGAALVEPGHVPSLLVYSDGNETEGHALALQEELAQRHIPVDVVPARRTSRPEILVRSLDVPGEVRPSARFDLSAEVETTVAQKVVVSLYRDDFLAPGDSRREVDLPVGKTTLRWKSEVPRPGVAHFSVRLSGALQDQVTINNRADAVTLARGNPRVLLVEGGAGSPALAAALAQEHIDVEVRAPSGLPADAAQLQPYDLVILSDTGANAVGPAQSAAIEHYVEGGGGFLFSGGENATDGWTGTRIEKLLPVRFDKERRHEDAQLALALAIDRSGSMETEGRLELAKEAAKGTAELLGPDDLITVIAFDSLAQPIVRLQRAANRLRIATDIARLRPGGGTAILPALREAYTALESANAKVKHVILLTDGQASYEGIPELVREMVEHKITVSAVGVGADADRSLLTTIAQRGQGRFYFTRDADQIPKIFLKETSEVAKRSLVEEPTRVRIARAAELFAGTGVESAPPLAGYVTVKPKPGGEVLLVSQRGDPLLARRRDGLGQTAMWASDAKNRWATAWLGWPGFARFFAQLVRSTMRPPLAGAGAYPIDVDLADGRATVRVDATAPDDRFISGLDGYAELVDAAAAREAGDPRARVPLVERAPGRYEAVVPLDVGDRTRARLLCTVLRRDGVEISRSLRAVTLPQAQEHLALEPDLALLTAFGGRVDPAPGDVFRMPSHVSPSFVSRRPLWPYFLWAALVLLVLDLAIRRIPTSRPSPAVRRKSV
ncbi:MAG: VWA domain-containing protein, partial [Polyangia bacterium]